MPDIVIIDDGLLMDNGLLHTFVEPVLSGKKENLLKSIASSKDESKSLKKNSNLDNRKKEI